MFDETPQQGTAAVVEQRARARYAEYDAAVAKAEDFHRRGRFDEAAAYASLAALSAMRPHAGVFVSPRLERLLVDIGRRTARRTNWKRPVAPKIKRILHVVSEILPVGGLTNNLVHWLQSDTAHTHSLAAIHHRHEIPPAIAAAIRKSGGSTHRLNQTVGHQVALARRLRALSQQHDAVVLHVYGQDPVAIMAFADPMKRPPVLLLNHADHLFWLGASIADVVLNMREAAQDLSITRRRVAPERNIVVPTVVSPPVRTRSREQAKQELGIAPDTVLLFSAARGMKYRTVDGVTFAAPHVDLLNRHPNARLLVLGAGDRPDWKHDIEATGGRIQSLPETPDPRLYYEAADIYVDSFPFVSSTSMMEAAGLGTPLVSRFYGPREARIFAINHPGIDAPTLHAGSEAEYVAHLDRLISDPALRVAKAEEARLSVLEKHTAPGWLAYIERAYRLAEDLLPVDPVGHCAPSPAEGFSHGEPDRSLYDVFGFPEDRTVRLLRSVIGLMPMGERLRTWRKLRDYGALDGWKDGVRLLLPNWLVRRLSDRA